MYINTNHGVKYKSQQALMCFSLFPVLFGQQKHRTKSTQNQFSYFLHNAKGSKDTIFIKSINKFPRIALLTMFS